MTAFKFFNNLTKIEEVEKISYIRLYNLVQNGLILNTKPASLAQIRKAFGGVLKLERMGIYVIPICRL